MPIDHGRTVEVRRGGRWFRANRCGRELAYSGEQGEPEELGVVLVALHVDSRDPVLLGTSARPGLQQRCLSAAGGRGDNGDSARDCAVQRALKIVSVDDSYIYWTTGRHLPVWFRSLFGRRRPDQVGISREAE